MTKNIILCSDGTGNKGGYTPDSNVYRLYNAIDHADPRQVSFYDNGVGTATNKYLRAISGAFGFGFNQNVMDLYEFLARQYENDAAIYMFGFSRGAATIRAFAGMLQVVGLLDKNAPNCKTKGKFDERKFQDMLEEARRAYIHHKKCPDRVEAFRKHCVKNETESEPWRTKIRFIGVWDTVSALGFPQDWSAIVNLLFKGLDYWSDFVFPHRYYEYQLDDQVECACHALALDDERKTFHPRVWWEKAAPDGSRDKHPNLMYSSGSEYWVANVA